MMAECGLSVEVAGDMIAELRTRRVPTAEKEELEKQKQEIAIMRRSARLQSRISFGRYTRGGIVTAATVGIFGLAASLIYRGVADLNSPEAVRKRQEEELQGKLKLERENTLGLEPSSISYSNWRIRYPKMEKGIRYVEVGGENSIFQAISSYMLKFERDKKQYETYILASDYKRSDGVTIPMLTISLKGGIKEPWILRTVLIEEIDNRVVIFENIKEEKLYYFAVSRTKSFSTSLEFRLMRQERIIP